MNDRTVRDLVAARPRALASALIVVAVTATLGALPSAARGQPVDPQAEPADSAPAARYGFALRMPRYVTIPGWLLGLFAEEYVPLHTFGSFAVEFVRRTDYDIVLALGYQNLSTDDGNWLGKNKDASLETDLVQFRDFSFIAADITYVKREMLNQYFGVHGRAGLGLAIMRGKILRTSNSERCTAANAGDERACRPIVCEPDGCTEEKLRAIDGRLDGGPTSPVRFPEGDVPGALPILNLAVGLDLRLPQWKGFEARLEGGFYNAFFLGLAFGYMF